MGVCRPCALLLSVSLGAAALPAHGQSTLPLRQSIDETAPVVTPMPLPEPPPPDMAPARRVVADPYAPTGISAGTLRLYPSLTIGGVVTSNVSRSANNAKADAGLNLRPALRTETDWVRHAWTTNASGELTFYAGNSDLKARDLNLSQKLRLDVRHTTSAEFETGYVLSQSGQEDSNVPATATGFETEHALTSSAALTHDFGGLTGRVKAGATWRIYDDVDLAGGGSQNNSDREYVEPSLAFRATYSEPPLLKPYAEVAYAPRIHAITRDRNGLRRDSDGFTASLGAEIESGPIWTGDLALTYLHRNYDDPALDSNSAVGLNGELTWSPTDLSSIVMSFGTSLAESTSATSSGSRNWTAGLAGTHAARDNIDVMAGVGVELEKSDGGTDVTYDANLGLSWKMNPALSWTAAYDLTWLDAAGTARDYTEHRVTAGMTLSR